MRFRNAVHLTVDNFSNVFKTLLYRIVTGIVFFSLSYVILRSGLDVIMQSAEMDALKTLGGEFIRAILSADAGRLAAIQGEFPEAVKALGALVAANIGSIVGSLIGVCVMYLLSRFFNGLSVFAVAGTLNDRMSLSARTSFSVSYFRNAGKAALYQLIYVPLSFVYDVACFLLCWLFFFYAPSFMPSWNVVTVFLSLALAITAIVCLEALKMTVISAWMPAMLADGQSAGTAFKTGFRMKKRFGARFASYIAAIYLIIVVNVAFAVFTFGSALLLTVPLSFLFLLCLQFAHFYEDTNRKYFISSRRITGGDDTPQGSEE